MKYYYFGVLDKSTGHQLHDVHGKRMSSNLLPKDFPCKPGILDGGLLPPNEKQIEGRAALIWFPGWTVLTFWNRSIDHRLGSSSAFVIPGTLNFDWALKIAQESFPSVWKQIAFEVTYEF